MGTNKLRVGLFVLVAAVIAGFGVLKLGDVSFDKTYSVYVYFDDVSGMTPKSPVKIAGVEVGSVRAIDLDAGKARAELAIKQGVVLYRDAKARVASTGIIGTKYLDMTPGSPSQERLVQGDAISGLSVLSLEESVAKALESVKGLTEAVRGPHGDDLGRNLNAMIANLNAVSTSVKEIMEDRKMDISMALLSMKRVTAALNEIVDKTDRILARVEKGEGAVGTLLVDQKAGEEVKASMASMKEATAGAAELFGRFTRIRAFWDYDYRYDTAASQGRSDFGLTLSPRPGKYYFAGVSNLGNASTPFKADDFENKNTINLGMGKEFYPWLDLYAGVIRSEGGIGARIKPLPDHWLGRKFSVEAEAYGAGRQSDVNGRSLTGAVYNVGLAAEVFPWLRLTVRSEDAGQVGHVHSGMSVTLEDKDLAYLLGLVTVTR
ncbi:MAG: MCE family protein [Elusimicrobia bacterium]|nr:MCE family protein [Elusimicrobiota bacterium]